MPADQVLLGKHLGAALGHLHQATIYAQKLAADSRVDSNAVNESRAELKGIVELLDAIDGRWRPG